MKRTVRILALVLVFAMAVTALVSCGNRLSGNYESVDNSGNVVILSFDGNEFSYKQGTTELKGTYKVKKSGENHTITMTLDEKVVDGKAEKLEEPYDIYTDTTLRIGEDYISIGSGTSVKKYTKK